MAAILSSVRLGRNVDKMLDVQWEPGVTNEKTGSLWVLAARGWIRWKG